jgi:hypothetical protein
VAKEVAASLNNCPIGGKKGGYYHDDIWNLKYLRGFKWDYLTEKLAYERRTKESKLSLSMMQVTVTTTMVEYEQAEYITAVVHVLSTILLHLLRQRKPMRRSSSRSNRA